MDALFDCFNWINCTSIIGLLSFYQVNWHGIRKFGQNLLAIWSNWVEAKRLDSIIGSLDKTWFLHALKENCKLRGWVSNQISILKIKIEEFERINLY